MQTAFVVSPAGVDFTAENPFNGREITTEAQQIETEIFDASDVGDSRFVGRSGGKKDP